ncbi:MAG: hypothetical protein QOJ25_1299 [Solirubrobacteraceae bacterium]|nr:hypothetical protein [Solirubrobacteraceae bacterium]
MSQPMLPDGDLNRARCTVGREGVLWAGAGDVCVVDEPVVLVVDPVVLVPVVEEVGVVALAGGVPVVVDSERVTVTIVFDDPHPATRAAAITSRSAPRITAAAYPRIRKLLMRADDRGGVASPP